MIFWISATDFGRYPFVAFLYKEKEPFLVGPESLGKMAFEKILSQNLLNFLQIRYLCRIKQEKHYV